MANSVIVLRTIAARVLRLKRQLAMATALMALGAARLLPAPYFQGSDHALGRPGDTLLLLAVSVFSVLLYLAWPRRSGELPVDRPAVLRPLSFSNAPIEALLDIHLHLDQEIDKKLMEVVADTETSAIDIIKQVRELYDTANSLVVYLNSSSPQADTLGKDIVNSVAYLIEIGEFIEQLPGKMTRDMDIVQSVVKEIKDLNEMVGAVQAISMQSHLLAINAAIEGSRAGPSGAAFRIVAQEMRKLASDSSEVASKIKTGLTRARHVVEDGMANSISESTQQLHLVSHAVGSIQKLRENFEDMSQYFKTRFAVVTKHNEDLAKEISNVLGHIQYQDVVSQCIDRLRGAIGERNAFLQSSVTLQAQGSLELAQLPEQLALILNAYQSEEEKHRHSARHNDENSSELKFELF